MAYRIHVTYANGRSSQVPGLRYKEHVKAALREMVVDNDIRMTADKIQLLRNNVQIAELNASTLTMGDVEGIDWPRAGNPRRLKDSRKLSLVMPGVIAQELEAMGKGNYSKGLQEMFLKLNPDINQAEFFQ